MAKNPENMTREELLEQQRKIAELLESQKKDTINELRAKWEQEAADNGLTFLDVVGKSSPGRVSRSDKGSSLPPKYRDKEGNEWSGRGVVPNFWKGMDVDEIKKRFAIKEPVAEGRKSR